MKQRLLYLLRLYLYYIVFFLLAKIIFLVFHADLTLEAGVFNTLPVFWHGLRLDLSAAAYLMLIPILLVFFSSLIRKKLFEKVMPWYNGIILVLLSIVIIGDLELYKFWGFRLDVTPLLYLKTPKDALASVSTWIIIRQLMIAAVLVILFVWLFRKYIMMKDKKDYKLYELPVYLFLIAFLIIPVRGGVGIAPINVGSAYFSQNSYLNHAAINVFWNLGNSLVNQNGKLNKYEYFDENYASNLVQPYLNRNDTTESRFIHTDRPNIVLIMLESFTANVIEPLGGMKAITPSLNSLSGEGILFTNFYASGDRSDKGLVSILSGYPAQATYSVIKDAAKTQTMPKLPLDLKKTGYHTAFYYGGDPDFANMRSYLISAGFSEIISKEDFPSDSYNSKWGAHDDVVFDRLLNDLNQAKSPFFKMIFTLSSHEPFEVPGKVVKGSESYRFLNTVHYTDSCLGDFIHKAKQTSWWSNTWVIIVADHGVRLPGNLKVHEPEKFHIPMLWIGGAVKQKLKIEKTSSQIDIPATVLNQLGLPAGQYVFSRNIFGMNRKTDAFYIYNNGIGMVNDTMKLVFDCTKNALLQSNSVISDSLVNISKAYIQEIYTDLNSRSLNTQVSRHKYQD